MRAKLSKQTVFVQLFFFCGKDGWVAADFHWKRMREARNDPARDVARARSLSSTVEDGSRRLHHGDDTKHGRRLRKKQKILS